MSATPSILEAVRPLDSRILPIYAVKARLAMTLRHLKWLAALAPVAIVVALEIVRSLTVGSTSLSMRLILDSVVAVAFIVFGFVMVRAVGSMHDRLRRQNQELLALHGAALDVTAELSLDAVLDKVVERARRLVGARYGALSVVNGEGEIEAFLTSGITPEQRQKIGPPPSGHGLLGVVLREGQHLRLDDISKDSRSHGFPPNHPVMRTLLAVPITCKSPFVGNLYLSEKESSGPFTEDDQQTLERFAIQAAIAIDNAHLHRQLASLAVAQERLRIAHEMHDGIAQVLGYVNTKVQAALEYIRREKDQEAAAQLRELATAAREAYSDVREAIVDLRALSEPRRSFTEVLREYVVRWKEQTGISTELTVDRDAVLGAGTELQLIRIIQEALGNVRKHARATTASIVIHQRGAQLVLTISDDGIGFKASSPPRSEFPRFGLATMRERAENVGGTLTIESSPGKGTIVRIEVPLAV